MMVHIFPDICPGKNEKTKKVDHLEVDLTRLGSIRVDFNQIVHIFPMSKKKIKNEKTKKVDHLEVNLGR